MEGYEALWIGKLMKSHYCAGGVVCFMEGMSVFIE